MATRAARLHRAVQQSRQQELEQRDVARQTAVRKYQQQLRLAQQQGDEAMSELIERQLEALQGSSSSSSLPDGLTGEGSSAHPAPPGSAAAATAVSSGGAWQGGQAPAAEQQRRRHQADFLQELAAAATAQLQQAAAGLAPVQQALAVFEQQQQQQLEEVAVPGETTRTQSDGVPVEGHMLQQQQQPGAQQPPLPAGSPPSTTASQQPSVAGAAATHRVALDARAARALHHLQWRGADLLWGYGVLQHHPGDQQLDTWTTTAAAVVAATQHVAAGSSGKPGSSSSSSSSRKGQQQPGHSAQQQQEGVALDPVCLSQTLWACGSLLYCPPAPALEVLLAAAAQQLPCLGWRPLANITWALGRLQVEPGDAFWSAFWPTTQRLLLAASGAQSTAHRRPLSSTGNGTVANNSSSSRGGTHSRDGITPQALVNVLWGLATLGVSPPQGWLAAWMSASAASGSAMREWSSQDAANAAWALAKLGANM
jgi:hypothetical protein